MNIKRTVNEIATRPMDRKEFLASTGAVALSLIGVTAVLRSLSHEAGKQSSTGAGYGASAYGGNKTGR